METPGDYGSLEEYFRHYRNPRSVDRTDHDVISNVRTHAHMHVGSSYTCLYMCLCAGSPAPCGVFGGPGSVLRPQGVCSVETGTPQEEDLVLLCPSHW